MDLPLNFLRNWLPLPARDDGSAGAQALREWMESMRNAAPEEIATSLSHRLPAMLAERDNLHMRVKLLDTFDEIAGELLPAMEQEVSTAPLPFSAPTQARALAADNLLKSLAAGYAGIVGSVEAKHLAAGLGPLTQHVIQHAIAALRRRQLLAYRAYATPSTASWQQLHELYRVAKRLNLLGPAKTGQPVEQLYVATLLIAYAEPGKLARTELDTLLDCAERSAALVHLRNRESLHEAHAGAPIFFVAADESGPGKPLVRSAAAGHASGGLYLDCTNLAATLRSDIGAKARLDMPHTWLLPDVSLGMLRTLAAMWGGQPTRRYSRMRFKPRADLVIGLADVARFLAGGAFIRRREDATHRQEGQPAISEWALVDESPDGFGIRYIKGELDGVEVGDIVGIRPRESSRIQICLVRRVSNAGQTRFELGLQNLSPHALPIEIPDPAGERRQAILLPRMPAWKGAAGLVTHAGTVRDDLDIGYATGGNTIHFSPAQRLDGNRSIDFHLLKTV